MRKSIIFLATLLSLFALSCQKEANQKLTPVDNANLTEITANASEADTKAYVDGLQVKWSSGDVIAVADASDNPIAFTLTSGANTASAKFGGDLGGSTLGTYAVYPKTTNSTFDENEVLVDYLTSWDYGKSEVPMYGVKGLSDVYTFYNIGGAVQVTYKNLPGASLGYFFKLTETGSKKITGTVDVSNLDSTPSVSTSGLSGQTVTVNNIPKEATEVTLVIPVPAGSGYAFQVELWEVGGAEAIDGSVKNASSRTITSGKILRFPDIVIPPVANGTILWADNFGDFGDAGTTFASITGADISDYASAGYPGRSGCGDNARVTLSGSGSVKVSTTSTSGLTSGHLWFNKSADGTITSSAIKLYGATAFTLEYDQANKSSETIAKYSDDGGVNWKTIGDASTQTGAGHAQFSKSGLTASSILIRISHQSSNGTNTRIDNIEVRAGLPEPYITVTTGAASSVSESGATLNGTINLYNLAAIGTVTSAGFYYKKTLDSGDYNQVSVATPLATANFSKELDGLDKEEYTYYAYASYDSGVEVTGDPKTFTPNSTPAGEDPDANGICFNLTSYSSLPTGWDCDEVDTNASYFIVNVGGSMISPSYNLSSYDSATVYVSIRNYGSGSGDAKATLYVSYDGGSSWDESTSWTASGSNSAKTYNLAGALSNNVAIKVVNSADTGNKALRVFSFKLQGFND